MAEQPVTVLVVDGVQVVDVLTLLSMVLYVGLQRTVTCKAVVSVHVEVVSVDVGVVVVDVVSVVVDEDVLLCSPWLLSLSSSSPSSPSSLSSSSSLSSLLLSLLLPVRAAFLPVRSSIRFETGPMLSLLMLSAIFSTTSSMHWNVPIAVLKMLGTPSKRPRFFLELHSEPPPPPPALPRGPL